MDSSLRQACSWNTSLKDYEADTVSNLRNGQLRPNRATASLFPSRSGIRGPAIAVVVIGGSVGVAVIIASCPLIQPLAALGTSGSFSWTIMENSYSPSLLE